MSKKLFEKIGLNGIIIFFLILLVGAVFFTVVRVFVIPVIASLVITSLVYPLYRYWGRLFPKRRGIASVTFCFLLLLVLFVPLFFLGRALIGQAQDLYSRLESSLSTSIDTEGGDSVLQNFENSMLVTWLEQHGFAWRSWLDSLASTFGDLVSRIVNKTSSGIFQILSGLFIFFFSMFYFLRDTEKMKQGIKRLSPLPQKQEKIISRRFKLIARAVILGTIVIGLIQGSIGSATFFILGIKGWAFWGACMTVLAIIPFVGIYIIMLPAALIQFVGGNILFGIILIVVGTAVNWLVDYFIRPWFVGKQSKVHDLLIFFSTIGGIVAYGPIGFIVGPVILTLFISLLEIYRKYIRPEIQK
mgnify:CR=1 FL=1